MRNLDKDIQDVYLNCISECIPNLIRRNVLDQHIAEEKGDDDALLQEAADLALKLLKWRNGDDFNLSN